MKKMGSGDRDPRILKFGTRWKSSGARWGIQSTISLS
jgi:hypothetical protein